MELRPLADRVIVEPLEEEEKTSGGIVLPDAAKKKPQKGKVLAVGTGRVGADGERIPVPVKVGDTVLFASYAGTEVKVNGTKYLIMNESDLLAVVQG